MTLPMTYTDHSLAVYMQALLGPIADIAGIVVGESDPGDFTAHIDQIKLELGTADLSGVTDLKSVRAFGSYFAWILAVERLAPLYSLKFEGTALERQQIYEHARQRFALAEYRLLRHDSAYSVDRQRAAEEE